MNKRERIMSLDFIRGTALMFIIFFHSSIYNFANIHRIDFSNPPIFIVLMSFMALWGGIFIIYSMTANAFMLMKRWDEKPSGRHFQMLSLAALFYIAVHYALNLIFGRWNIDFVNNMPHLTLIAGTLRNGSLSAPAYSKYFEGSSVSTILANMLLCGWLLYFMLKERMKRRNIYAILSSAGAFVILFSFVRVFLYGQYASALDSRNALLGTLYSFLLANPYPLITYFSYGLFGTLLGLLIYDKRRDLMKRLLLPVGGALLLFGIFGMMKFEKTISKPDFFWYFKTLFELGLFILSITSIYLGFEGKKMLANLSVIRSFSRISLTIYLLEATLSEILRKAATPLFPGWDQTINACLLFGLFNVAVWVLIVFLWEKVDFAFSFEYFWVKLFRKLGKESTK